MKPLTASAMCALIVCALTACSIAKNSVNEPLQTPIDYSQSPTCIVYSTNGTAATYHRLKLVTGVLKTPYLLANNTVKLNTDSIMAYEADGVYALSQKTFSTKAKGHIATKVLPGFAIKEVSGAINLYSLQVSNNNYVTKKYFLQQGNKGAIVPYTATLLKQWYGQNAAIANFVKGKSKKINEAELIAIIQHCNTQQSLSVN